MRLIITTRNIFILIKSMTVNDKNISNVNSLAKFCNPIEGYPIFCKEKG